MRCPFKDHTNKKLLDLSRVNQFLVWHFKEKYENFQGYLFCLASFWRLGISRENRKNSALRKEFPSFNIL
jgi:hypothetical protein